MQGSHTKACTNGHHCHGEVSTTQREGHTMDVQEGIIRVDGYQQLQGNLSRKDFVLIRGPMCHNEFL
jgi:hypothetical protein